MISMFQYLNDFSHIYIKIILLILIFQPLTLLFYVKYYNIYDFTTLKETAINKLFTLIRKRINSLIFSILINLFLILILNLFPFLPSISNLINELFYNLKLAIQTFFYCDCDPTKIILLFLLFIILFNILIYFLFNYFYHDTESEATDKFLLKINFIFKLLLNLNQILIIYLLINRYIIPDIFIPFLIYAYHERPWNTALLIAKEYLYLILELLFSEITSLFQKYFPFLRFISYYHSPKPISIKSLILSLIPNSSYSYGNHNSLYFYKQTNNSYFFFTSLLTNKGCGINRNLSLLDTNLTLLSSISLWTTQFKMNHIKILNYSNSVIPNQIYYPNLKLYNFRVGEIWLNTENKIILENYTKINQSDRVKRGIQNILESIKSHFCIHPWHNVLNLVKNKGIFNNIVTENLCVPALQINNSQDPFYVSPEYLKGKEFFMGHKSSILSIFSYQPRLPDATQSNPFQLTHIPDTVWGWSLYDEPGVRCYLMIYYDYNFNSGFFTDKGDFFIPGPNFGFFKEQFILRDLEGKIIKDKRIHCNFRPNIFKGKIIRPPISPF